ncbi:uncharacterized protein LOC106659740 [Trichogramma pretiosum]|uniref:uncharacterized protein LOC106659740 n=1 Tax=Trichogramma pretiosum TaxID=7493 RepID=UPI000C718A97|nr:uncharacterized protein LOC106659740 [Trichogramma pretiosum]
MSSSSVRSDEQRVEEHPKLDELKRLRKNYFLKEKCHRHLLINNLKTLIKDWTERLPNLRDIFTRQEMDWLLEAIMYSFDQHREIVDFFICCGYKDEPDMDEDGKPLLRRTTPVHQIDQCSNVYCTSRYAALQRLFNIYDKFDVNYIDESGYSHFHVACKYGLEDAVKKFLEVGQVDPNLLVPKTGDYPLHLALKNVNTTVVGLLLRSGADPNLANRFGSTALHVLSKLNADRFYYERISKKQCADLLEICDEKCVPVNIDARDNEGNTPLHVALSYYGSGLLLASLLLRRGADPNSVNDKGETLLHIIAKQGLGEERIFITIKERSQQTVRIDARDNLGRTALEWAVASCSPPAVKSLLEYGADVSGFVFPTAASYDYPTSFPVQYCSVIRLAVATGLLAIVELLETKVGQELDLGDALKVMGFFDKYKLYERVNVSITKYVDSLADPILEQMAEKSTYMDYFKFARSYTGSRNYRSRDACDFRLCEKVTRKFFRDWALDCFMALIHYRLPILCCNMIIDQLTNKDLYYICLAAKGQTDEQDKINVTENVLKRNNERPVGDGNAPKRLKIEC